MCNCIDEMNAKLAEHNTRLTIPIAFSMSGRKLPTMLYVCTEQIESGRGKKKAVFAVATYCPFCGEKYEVEAALTPDAAPISVEDATLARTCYRGKTVEDGEIVLVHWPEGYRLRYHGRTVWKEPEPAKPPLTAN